MLIDKNPSFSNMSKQFYFRCQAQIKPTFCMFAKSTWAILRVPFLNLSFKF